MRFAVLLALLPVFSLAGIVDRVAVVVGKTVITESEIDDNLRIAAFLNGEPLDLSATQRRAAADRLVDQQLLRNEMDVTRFANPSAAAAADRQLRELIQRRFHSDGEYRAALERSGVTEDQLKEQLQWQLAVVAFTDFRFRSEIAPPSSQSADRASTDNTPAKKDAAVPAAESVDQQLDSWLKEAHTAARIVFKEEAFR